ncbi:hypothetical protein ACOME3_009157 [Neoechinorhynchus agilis]
MDISNKNESKRIFSNDDKSDGSVVDPELTTTSPHESLNDSVLTTSKSPDIDMKMKDKSSQEPDPPLYSIEAGVVNLGRTCWLSAIFQTFFHIPVFMCAARSFDLKCEREFANVTGMSQRKPKGTNASKRVDRTHSNSSLVELLELIERRRERPESLLCPRKFFYAFNRAYPNFDIDMDEDAHEFYLSLIGATLLSSKMDIDQPMSSIESLFRGKMRNERVCQTCFNETTEYQPFYSISLGFREELVGQAVGMKVCSQKQIQVSLKDMLNDFCETTHIEGCCPCGGVRSNRVTITECPTILCMHIKRFSWQVETKKFKKLRFSLKYDHMLDMEPFTRTDNSLSDNNKPLFYELQSVIVHKGQHLSNGHYHAICRYSAGSQTFYDYDDKNGNMFLKSKNPFDGQAYILFYTNNK